MLKVLFADSTEKEYEGRVKYFTSIDPVLCNYVLEINGKDILQYPEIKLIYDTDSKEGIYLTKHAYNFFFGLEEYKKLREKM